MLSASRPRQNGSRYSSTAVFTASGRWLNVAQPKPYRPGSLVSTLTTTKRILGCGAVRIGRTLVILSGGSPLEDLAVVCASASSFLASNPSTAAAVPRPAPLSMSRRFICEIRGSVRLRSSSQALTYQLTSPSVLWSCGPDMPRLIVHSQEGHAESIELHPGTNRLGRGRQNDFVIEHATVSTAHCEIIVEGETVLIRDCGSTNGTFVKGQRIKEATLKPGEALRLGEVEMALESAPVTVAIPLVDFREPPAPPPLADGSMACLNHPEVRAG